jgi:hypothetical protein
MDEQVRTASGATEASGHDYVTEHADQESSDLHKPIRNINRATHMGRAEEQCAGKQHRGHGLNDLASITLEQQWRLLICHSVAAGQ